MKKIIEILKRFWLWSAKLTTSNLWLLGFPTAMFALVAILAHSILVTLAFIAWIITIIHNTDEAD